MQDPDTLAGAKVYEHSYMRDVLGLEEGAREEELDDRLIAEAKELGIDVQTKQTPDEKQPLDDSKKRPVSMPILSAETVPRRSSIDSRASVATSMTSTSSSIPPRHANGISKSRASLSFRDYDRFLSKGRPEGRSSISFSRPETSSASTSVFSLPLSSRESSPKKHYRLMRGLSRLKLNRVDSATSLRTCPHCPRDQPSQWRAVYKLPCGHRLCTQALRETIKATTTICTGATPSCCGDPIPGYLVEQVMTQQEQRAVLERLEQWTTGSVALSANSEARKSPTEQRPTVSRTASNESKVDSVAPQSKRRAQVEDERPELTRLRKAQTDLNDRFTVWISTQRNQLAANHDRLRSEMRTRHEAAIENLEEQHAHAMSEAEDKQVVAEADMRFTQAQETRDTATALKHMEAYCAGNYVSTGQPHGRVVTEQDRLELASARRVSEGLGKRHASAINVLRGEQARRLRLRGQRQEREGVELRRAHRREELGFERGVGEAGRGFEEFVEEKTGQLRRRWELQERVLERKLEVGVELSTVEAGSYNERFEDGSMGLDGQATAGSGFEGIRLRP